MTDKREELAKLIIQFIHDTHDEEDGCPNDIDTCPPRIVSSIEPPCQECWANHLIKQLDALGYRRIPTELKVIGLEQMKDGGRKLAVS